MANKLDNKENKVTTCLRNEKLKVRYISKPSDMIKDPKHALYGGLADKAAIEYVVPILRSSGSFVNVLTNDEKKFLENYMGLEEDALSIHKKKDNFWASYSVRLTKDGLTLNLEDPNDYIKYKVLKANTDFIAKSLQELEDNPKPTYRFVLVNEDSENTKTLQKYNSTKRAYMLLGRYEDDLETMKTIIEILEGRSVSNSMKKEGALTKLQDLLITDTKKFVAVAEDENLKFRVLLRKCINDKTVYKKGDYYYLAKDGSPMCGPNLDPTVEQAVAFLADPHNQQILFSLQEK